MTDSNDDRTRVVPKPGQPPTTTGDMAATVITAGATPVTSPATGSTDAGLLPVGSRLAEFEITRVIGQGGFGVVYEAWDHTLERVVAIKEYLPTSLSTRQQDGTVVPLSERHRETFDLGMRSFINEARLLAQFDHPSLLKVYRFWQEKGTTYMVMPFYKGDTLREALVAIPAGVDEAWLIRIMDGVTQALAVMHNANCYHRDIAPDNIILLEGSGRPVVLDFGAARRVITDKTQAITVILKPGYAPIEQYAEMPDMSQGAWTDVYALAAVMHVAVCGRAPPPSVARLLSDSYVPLAGNDILRQRYSPRLLEAIDAGLGVRPEQRPQSMAELRAALDLDAGGHTIAPVPRTQPPRVQQGGGNGADAATVIVGSAKSTGKTTGNAKAPASPAPAAASGGGKTVVAIASVVALAAVAGGGWWFLQGRTGGTQADMNNNNEKQQVAVAPTPAPLPDTKVAEAPPPPAPPPPPPPPAPRTPLDSLQSLAAGAAPGFDVTATPKKAEVTVGKDRLAFEVRSKREGFVYVFLLSSGGEMFLLFPNLLDKYNKITAGGSLSLPRASWPMDAGGPPGTDQFAVLVSEHERDFSAAGVQNDGVFPVFPLPVLAALEATRGSGPSPLLGKPVCAPAGAPCNDVYGVANFKIVEK
ncbi:MULTISPECIES: serine/threonine-protein kinase [Variovorax]|jgi:serine/threonine protein kinase|uniref:serine/threonine-protein kinase n=1 Tax=Variovorax TaxID=34072 RepID=UPI00086CDC0D|nr:MULTISPECIES: serine/threonine-protein kinase [Variovorax]MBN8755471.1 protein kinase [Variovorax sp.]ODU14104.1 MAG: serine/threonine protein kinase [Variovorax sp. SCN 67-85]ODV15327.1 MAG: serine/threonine protein kinase [Variovorax sp. SCN 67-20]OJZ12580.1 MAG: serine/threonine protein kinase [Variovorax sp. 67-131]UKI09321.1 serine/threonine-protein kinase [Variovorax paradoxus]